MGEHFSVLRLTTVIALSLWLPATFLAQGHEKSPDPRQEILEQLHPRLREQEAPNGIKLLQGYKHKGATDFEGNNTGKIWKKGGLKIDYAIGFSWGQEVDPKARGQYLQYSEEIVNGRIVRIAFTKDKVLMISVPLGDTADTLNAANFSTKVDQPEDAADLVTMALSLIR